jgi:DNA-binding CsgD family transcriptional regulator
MRRVKSPETVKSQRKSMLAKLGARNMAHAVAIAAQRSMLWDERAA